jgi:hypothetical protein
VQILASALPGFRDLRAPLTAGYLWLVLLWIWLKPDLAARPTNEIAGSIYDLGRAAGPIWVGLAVGIAAYLIGAVSQVLSPPLARTTKFAWDTAEQLVDRLHKRFKWIPPLPMSKTRSPLARYSDKAVEQGIKYLRRNAERERSEEEIEKLVRAQVANLADEALFEIDRDVSLPATLLLAKESLLFTEADRLKAENQFRLAIVPPLTAATAFLWCSSSNWWLLSLIPISILLSQSHIRSLEYRNLMYGALERNLIESDSVDMFRKLAEPPETSAN